MNPYISHTYHKTFALKERSSNILEWEHHPLSPFSELLISWNATRPQKGYYSIYTRVKIDTWSPWLEYARWGHDHQRTFSTSLTTWPLQSHQDTVEVLNKKHGTGFTIRIEAEEGASLRHLEAVHACASELAKPIKIAPRKHPLPKIDLDIPPLSQMELKHPHSKRICSPTSTTAALRYLLKTDQIDPITFAQQVWDHGFDIYGNWILNVAQASTLLGKQWHCWAARLSGLDHLVEYLVQGIPVVISIKGPLKDSAQPYHEGHLLVVKGCGPDNKILCMDPAFPSHDQTHVSYEADALLEAWGRRGHLAYVFHKAHH